MRRLGLLTSILLSSLVVSLPAGAQTADAALELADALRLARENSLAVQLGRQMLQGTELDRVTTISNVLPTLALSTSANYNDLPGLSGGGLGSFGNIVGFPASGTTVDTTLSANQVLFDAFATRDSLAIIDQTLQAGRLAIVQAEQEAMALAATSYFDVLRAEGLAGVAADGLKQAQEHLRLGTLRLTAGTGTRAEVLQLRAQLANAQGTFTQARNAVNLARLALGNALNAPLGERSLAPDPVVPALVVSIGSELRPAVERRPELQQLAARQKAEETRVSLESRALWPTLQAVGRYSQRNLNEGQLLAGITLNWTVFDSFKVRNRMATAQNQARVTQLQTEQARQRIALEIRQQYQTRQEAVARIQTGREGLAAAQEAYRLVLKRYTVGVATTFEVSDVQSTLIQSGNNYVLAINDLRVAEVRLARALGFDLAALVR